MLCHYYTTLTGVMKDCAELSKLVNESKLLKVVDDWKLFVPEKSLKTDEGYPCREEVVETIDELVPLFGLLLCGEGCGMELLLLLTDSFPELAPIRLPRVDKVLHSNTHSNRV